VGIGYGTPRYFQHVSWGNALICAFIGYAVINLLLIFICVTVFNGKSESCLV
jgi:hypothetical protein